VSPTERNYEICLDFTTLGIYPGSQAWRHLLALVPMMESAPWQSWAVMSWHFKLQGVDCWPYVLINVEI